MLKMYDLAGADPARRFSPYCWRVKFALAHKGLDVATIPWRFMQKDVINGFGSQTVPVLIDGDKPIVDSWVIANHLEEAYPDTPSLFGDPAVRAYARFVHSWCEATLRPPLTRVILMGIYDIVAEDDRDYFREVREKRFGMPFDEIVSDPPAKLAALRQALEPVRLTLQTQPYLSGERPLYPDYTLFGSFMQARCTSPVKLLEEDDPVYAWRERMLDAFGGMGRNAHGSYPA